MHRRPFASRLSNMSGMSGTPGQSARHADGSEGRRRPAPRAAGQATTAPDLLFLPMGYEPRYHYPLIVWLPDQERGPFDRVDLGRTMSLVSLRNFVAVLPAAGQGSDPERGVWRAIDRACREANVHPERIYLVGNGSGGTEAFRIGCRHPADFAGVVSLGGGFPLGETAFSRLHQVRRLRMLLCCRRDEASSPASAPAMDQTLRLFHAAGGSLSVRIYPGRSPRSRAMLGDVNRWIMDDVCGVATAVTPVLEET